MRGLAPDRGVVAEGAVEAPKLGFEIEGVENGGWGRLDFVKVHGITRETYKMMMRL